MQKDKQQMKLCIANLTTLLLIAVDDTLVCINIFLSNKILAHFTR